MNSPDAIHWPSHYAPACAPVHVRNALDMPVAATAAWTSLIRAAEWPQWYANSANVRFLRGAAPDLAPGTRFRWRTFGVTIDSTVLEFVPGERIAWDAHGIGIDAYHAWLITTTLGGCHVLTEETQHGWVARAGALLMPSRMHRFHQRWLESLARRAVSVS